MSVGVVSGRVTVFVHKGVGHKLTKGCDKPSVKLSKVEVTFPRTMAFLACPLESLLLRLLTNLRLVGNSGRGQRRQLEQRRADLVSSPLRFAAPSGAEPEAALRYRCPETGPQQ